MHYYRIQRYILRAFRTTHPGFHPGFLLGILLGILLGLFVSLPVVYSQEGEVDTSNLITYEIFPEFDPFTVEKPMEIQLEFDIKEFSRQKYKDKYQTAELRLLWNDSIFNTLQVRLKARGNFRRNYCHFPPIKLSFKNTDFNNEYMKEADKMKLVTHCKKSKTYEQYLLKEYLCYKMYNILTEYSFNVRLLVITYIDSQGKYDPFKKYGFIIEENTRLAERLDTYLISVERISARLTDYDNYHKMALFHFLIGNTDWSVPGLQNIKLLKLKDPTRPFPVAVPYDFDYSGMVYTSYAIPAESLGIETVRERLYRGYCIDEDAYQEFFQEFIEKKAELFNLIENFELLDKKHKSEMLHYIEEFYEIIESPFRAKKSIVEGCLN